MCALGTVSELFQWFLFERGSSQQGHSTHKEVGI